MKTERAFLTTHGSCFYRVEIFNPGHYAQRHLPAFRLRLRTRIQRRAKPIHAHSDSGNLGQLLYISHAAKCVLITAVCVCVCVSVHLYVCLPIPRCIPTLLHAPGCNYGEW